MKVLRLLYLLGLLLLACPTLQAQEGIDFLQKAKIYLDAGDCDKAQRAYDAYKIEHPEGDAEVQRRIDECKDKKNKPKEPIKPVVARPTVITLSVEDVTTTSATCRGKVTSDGGGPVIERGICYDVYKYAGATPSTHKKATTNGTGSFSITLKGLEQGRVFIVRAYATNSAGTSYGDPVTFTTKKETPPPPPPQEKTYKIGDDAEDFIGYSGYKIAYLDKTGKHGFAIKYSEYDDYTSKALSFYPSITELRLMYDNRYVLGLHGEYWSTTLESTRVFTGDLYKTFDFSTGTTKTRKVWRDYCHCLYIVRF